MAAERLKHWQVVAQADRHWGLALDPACRWRLVVAAVEVPAWHTVAVHTVPGVVAVPDLVVAVVAAAADHRVRLPLRNRPAMVHRRHRQVCSRGQPPDDIGLERDFVLPVRPVLVEEAADAIC